MASIKQTTMEYNEEELNEEMLDMDFISDDEPLVEEDEAMYERCLHLQSS